MASEGELRRLLSRCPPGAIFAAVVPADPMTAAVAAASADEPILTTVGSSDAFERGGTRVTHIVAPERAPDWWLAANRARGRLEASDSRFVLWLLADDYPDASELAGDLFSLVRQVVEVIPTPSLDQVNPPDGLHSRAKVLARKEWEHVQIPFAQDGTGRVSRDKWNVPRHLRFRTTEGAVQQKDAVTWLYENPGLAYVAAEGSGGTWVLESLALKILADDKAGRVPFLIDGGPLATGSPLRFGRVGWDDLARRVTGPTVALFPATRRSWVWLLVDELPDASALNALAALGVSWSARIHEGTNANPRMVPLSPPQTRSMMTRWRAAVMTAGRLIGPAALAPAGFDTPELVCGVAAIGASGLPLPDTIAGLEVSLFHRLVGPAAGRAGAIARAAVAGGALARLLTPPTPLSDFLSQVLGKPNRRSLTDALAEVSRELEGSGLGGPASQALSQLQAARLVSVRGDSIRLRHRRILVAAAAAEQLHALGPGPPPTGVAPETWFGLLAESTSAGMRAAFDRWTVHGDEAPLRRVQVWRKMWTRRAWRAADREYEHTLVRSVADLVEHAGVPTATRIQAAKAIDRVDPRENAWVAVNEDWAVRRYLTTVYEFQAFVDDDGYTTVRWWSREGRAWLARGGSHTRAPKDWADQLRGIWTNPVTGINVHVARAYAAWHAEREPDVGLPNGEDWVELIRRFMPSDTNHNNRRFSWNDPTPVGVFDPLQLPAGPVFDPIGNVRVHVETPTGPRLAGISYAQDWRDGEHLRLIDPEGRGRKWVEHWGIRLVRRIATPRR